MVDFCIVKINDIFVFTCVMEEDVEEDWIPDIQLQLLPNLASIAALKLFLESLALDIDRPGFKC
jgi:hypothetical protein